MIVQEVGQEVTDDDTPRAPPNVSRAKFVESVDDGFRLLTSISIATGNVAIYPAYSRRWPSKWPIGQGAKMQV